jgi:hypothetical protein
MAERISDTLVRADDGQIYEEVEENLYRLYQGELPEPTTESPSIGDVAKGVAAEASIATAGQAVGAFTGPFYPIFSFGSGVAGSYAAQEIEGREDISLGRLITAGVINMIPFSSAAKGVGAGTKITKEIVTEAAKTEAKRGAAIGAGEATAVSIIDNQRLPTFDELAGYGGVGALFGGSVGALTPKITKSLSKVFGKSIDEIDEAAASGALKEEDLVNMGVAADEVDARKIIIEASNTVADKQAAKTLRDALSSGRGSSYERYKSLFVPSKVTGREVQDIAFYGRNEIKAAQELGSKLSRRVDNFLKAEPSLTDDVNTFLDTGVLSPILKQSRIAGDLEVFNSSRLKMQSELVEQLSEYKFSNLNKDSQKSLLKTIQDSMGTDGPQYTTRQYELFENPNFVVDPVKKRAAIKEIAETIVNKNPKVSTDDALKSATTQINNLVKNSAKNRQLRDDTALVSGSTDSVLRARTNPGKAERAFLGEIVDPAERIRGTLDNVGRLVYKNKADINIASALRKAGLAFKDAPDDSMFTPLTLRGKLETNLFVPNNVQYALDKTYLAGYNTAGGDVIKEGLRDFYESSIGASKAVKVILNPPSYAVNAYGGLVTLVGSGINPLSPKYYKGVKMALAEYGWVDDMVGKDSAQVRKAWTEAINDMKKYGIANANVLASDIRQNFERGFFSEKLSKVFEPVGKLYQATDTAARFTVWATNQERLGKMFPTLKGEDLKLAAAKLTNDTFQNYEKLSNTIRVASKYGLMPQFVSFTAEFMRNIYNQTRYALQMVKGNFGADIGIDVAGANIAAMRAEGVKRLASLGAVIGGTEAMRQAYNASQGITDEEEAALKQTVVADFDKNKSLLFTVDEDTNKVSYVNLSYISPHAMLAEAFNAATEDKPLESLAEMLTDNFLGEGSFVARSAYQALSNVDANGRPISGEVEGFNKFRDQMNYFASEAFKPGVSREAEKIIDAATKEDPRYSFKDIVKRQLGYRINTLDIDTSAFFKIRDKNTKAQKAKSDYTNLVKYSNPTPQQAAEQYAKSNRIRQENLAVVAQHYSDLTKLGMSEEERIKVMKNAGVSSKDIIAIINNTYLPIPTDVELSSAELYDERFQGMEPREVMQVIRKIAQEDRVLASKLYEELKQRRKQEQSNLTEKQRLIKNLRVDDRVAYIIANPDEFQELRRKGIVTKEVALRLKLKGFRP